MRFVPECRAIPGEPPVSGVPAAHGTGKIQRLSGHGLARSTPASGLRGAAVCMLHRWARRRSVGTEHAAIAGERAKQGLAACAVVKILARVRRHDLGLAVTAMRAGAYRFQHNVARIFRIGAHPSTTRAGYPASPEARRIASGVVAAGSNVNALPYSAERPPGRAKPRPGWTRYALNRTAFGPATLLRRRKSEPASGPSASRSGERSIAAEVT